MSAPSRLRLATLLLALPFLALAAACVAATPGPERLVAVLWAMPLFAIGIIVAWGGLRPAPPSPAEARASA